MNEKRSLLIFDANIFLTGLDFNLIKDIIYTTPGIIDEIKAKRYSEKNRNIINKIQAAIDSKKLIVRSPSRAFVEQIEEKSKLTGDYKSLSEQDSELVALALELLNANLGDNIIIYTNDYSIENLCSELNIPFSPLGKNGIRNRIYWEVYCPFCKDIRNIQDFDRQCETCGQPLKRRPKK
jgi:rRNA maturation endonuclease Nob1